MNPKRSRAKSLSLDWDNIVKIQSEGRKILKAGQYVVSGATEFERATDTFCTGSSYTGKWNALGMSGFGTYVFPHGAEYEGYMEDGMFHGDGTITYPMGQKIDGVWVKGKMVSFKFRFADGLEYEDPWEYCKMPERRFYTSLHEGLQPAGRENLTSTLPTRVIDEGCYDTGDGYYNPLTKCVTSPTDSQKVVRDIDQKNSESISKNYWSNFIGIPTKTEEKWITENCRKAWDEPTGYRPDLYEEWVSGRREELSDLDSLLQSKMLASNSESDYGEEYFMEPKESDKGNSSTQLGFGEVEPQGNDLFEVKSRNKNI